MLENRHSQNQYTQNEKQRLTLFKTTNKQLHKQHETNNINM